MNSKRSIFYWLATLSFVISACAGLPTLGNEEADTVDTPYGPQITDADHQTEVFEEILKQVETNYIYYETGNIDWASLRQKYMDQIQTGLTYAEFDALMNQFEAEFPTGELTYVTRDDRIAADTAPNTTAYGGIGAFISFQAEDIPHVVILDVMPGSPAEKAGLRAHDSIYSVNGDPVRLEEGGNVVQRIRGEAGTSVTLTIQSPGKGQSDIEITRSTLSGIGKVKANLLTGKDIGYILMPTTISSTTAQEVADALTQFSANKNLKGVILDLRISNSNNNWPIEEMLTLFLDKTSIDIYSRASNEAYVVSGQDIAGSQTIPLTVLVGEHTSGAPEIFAAAVQSSGRGIVIGSDTTGAIESPGAFPLSNGGQVFIASASFRIGEDEIGIHGLSPKVQVEAKWDEITTGQDPVIEKAIQSFEVQP